MQEVEESMNELSAKPVDVDETDYDTAYGGPTQADAFDLGSIFSLSVHDKSAG